MRHERLAQVMQVHQEALAAGQEPLLAHETILSVLRALDQGEITAGRAVSLLGYQAVRLAGDPTQAVLFRQAAADLRQLQREEHWHA